MMVLMFALWVVGLALVVRLYVAAPMTESRARKTLERLAWNHFGGCPVDDVLDRVDALAASEHFRAMRNRELAAEVQRLEKELCEVRKQRDHWHEIAHAAEEREAIRQESFAAEDSGEFIRCPFCSCVFVEAGESMRPRVDP